MTKSVLITEFMDEAAVDLLRSSFETVYSPEVCVDRPALLNAIRNADALIVRNRTIVDKELISAAPRLIAVGRLGVGLDNIDVKGCEKSGVAVFPAVGANAAAVAEYVVGVTMMLMRGFTFHSDAVAQGQWPRAQLSSGREAAGKILGVVGFGSVGQTVAGLARSVGMEVIAYDPTLGALSPIWNDVSRCDELDDLFKRADCLTLHIPLTQENQNLVDQRRLSLMKPSSVLINTSRGGIVNEADLADSLRNGVIAAAAVDVFEHEPLPAGTVLAGVPNLLLTPHIAGVTTESNRRVSLMIAKRIANALQQ